MVQPLHDELKARFAPPPGPPREQTGGKKQDNMLKEMCIILPAPFTLAQHLKQKAGRTHRSVKSDLSEPRLLLGIILYSLVRDESSTAYDTAM